MSFKETRLGAAKSLEELQCLYSEPALFPLREL